MKIMLSRPWIAHRGLFDLARSIPENSLAAFEAAIAGGYGVELDVQPAADGTPLVFHDDDLLRMIGQQGKISDLSASQAAKLHLSNTDQTIPSLDQVLARVSGRTPLWIEVKISDHHKQDANFQQSYIQAILDAVDDYPHPFILQSFDLDLMRAMKQMRPDLCYGFITEKLTLGDYIKARNFDFISFDHQAFSAPLSIFHRIMGGISAVWTLSSPAQLQKLTPPSPHAIIFEGFSPNS